MKVNQTTKDFCKYMVDSKLLSPEVLEREDYMLAVQDIITHMKTARKSKSQSVQLIATEYDEWCELYKH